jgi:hypothetical protein
MTTPDTLGQNFIEQIKRDFCQRDDVQRNLQQAAHGADYSRESFVAALKGATVTMRKILWDLVSHRPNEAGVGVPTDQRARAAYWFLHGHDAGFWKASDDELSLARALVLVHYGVNPDEN